MKVVPAVVCAALIWTAWTAPLSAATGAPANAGCASTEQINAAQLRQFHYQLQVAALNCRADNPALPGKWQSYVQRHAATLSENAGILLRYFKSASAFDRHNTILTNRESVNVHETHGYCEMRAPQFDKVVTLTGAQLNAYAAEMVGSPDNIRPCRDSKPQKVEAPASAKPKKTASRD